MWCYFKIAFYQLGVLEQTYVRGLAVFFLKVKPMFSGLIKRKLNFVRPREFRIDFRRRETWSKTDAFYACNRQEHPSKTSR
mmetsp:Transcript_102015/g.164424  ORF Transcript_102015/g.164424 Transcript_102015/m.164424 type:complete len:81 (-) Transcript_102015:590-832(-)